jgi:membrane protein YqaA with SNARE-associated domain
LLEEHKGKHERLKKISFALGGISIVSWLSAFMLAMLKDLFTLPYLTLLAGYVVLLAVAVAGSQVAKKYYEKQTTNENL